MPIVPATGATPVITGIVGPTSMPSSTQSSMRALTGSVGTWNPDCPIPVVQKAIQNAYRRVVDYRNWYGLQQKGQIVVPDVYTTGTVAATNGSNVITGTGTAFTAAMVGRQFRTGFSQPIYTILSVDSPTQISLDMNWGGTTLTAAGYSIFQSIVTPGSNVKFLLEIVNQRQGFKLRMNVPQAYLNAHDVWRTRTGWTSVAASFPASPAGALQFELYPIPTTAQAFPFTAYVQPKDLIDDGDYPAAFIRSDIIEYGAISKILLFRGKNNKFYDPSTSQMFEGMFQAELQKLSLMDDNLSPRDVQYDYANSPFVGGADYAQANDI